MTTVGAVLGLLVGGMVAVVPTAIAATPRTARDVPVLRSDPAPKVTPERLAGDFSSPPPNPSNADAMTAPAKPSAYDPARSIPIDAETTPTKKVVTNTDGSRTEISSATPVRFRDAGGWHDIDLTLVPGAGGALGATSAQGAATLAPRADGTTPDATVATIDTPAGPISLRHSGSAPSPAVVDKATATYKGALGGRDLILALTVTGLEETVVVPNAKLPGTYTDEFVLPAGVSARDTAAGVEFVDAKATVLATLSNGVAFDAAPGARRAATPVTVHVVANAAATPSSTATATGAPADNVATVQVGVDQSWFSDPARVFPVSIDPTVTAATNAADAYGIDTFGWAAAPTTTYGTATALYSGNASGVSQSFIKFNNLVVAPGPDVWVTESHLLLLGGAANDCSKPVNVQGIDGTLSAATAWNNRPAVTGGLVSTTTLGAGCGSIWNAFDTTSLARRWLGLNPAPNNGLRVSATDEADPAAFKWFWSGNTANPPFLYVTYEHLPSLSSPVSPATASVVNTATPTLATAPATDPEGDPIKYWFRATPAPDAESGAKMVDSGWLDPVTNACGANICYTAPVGALSEGVTYSWHAWTKDPYSWRAPTGTPFTFRIDLGLGAKGPEPRDAIGPASVNLASGNAVVHTASPSFSTAGGPVGLAYTYNSKAPANLGLTGSYFPDPGTHLFPSPSTPPAMVRTDPTIDHYWGTDGPGLGLSPNNFLVRWTGTITAPAGGTGSYTFAADHDDGMKIWVNNIQILSQWSDGAVQNPSGVATPINLVAGTPVSIRVEYYQAGGAAFATVSVVAPGSTVPTQVPPTWLTPDAAVTTPVLAAGWTLAPGQLSYASAILGDRWVGFVDTSGATHTYTWSASGYTPPAGDDGVVGTDASGALTLHATDGVDYVFDGAGRLASATSALDDGGPGSVSSLTYTYTGTKPRLTTITDGAAGRTITLHYGSTTPCTAAPADALCEVDYWDGTMTKLTYTGTGPTAQLTRIEDPGVAVTDFAYTAGRLASVRSPLANDAVAAPVTGRANDATVLTVLGYDAAPTPRVSSVTLPAPLLGAARPAHTYDYSVVNQATVHTDYPSGQGAVFEPAGFSRRVSFQRAGDGTWTITDTNANGIAATAVIDGADHPLSATDTAGRESTKVYSVDITRSHPIGTPSDTFGAAPSACFGTDRRPVSSCSTPPAHTTTTYDAAADGTVTQGLAATYWPNLGLSGPPARHGTVAPAAGNMVAADPPGGGLASGAWSARYTGEVIFDASGTYTFTLALAGSGRLYVDDTLVIDAWGAHGATVSGTFAQPSGPVTRRRIRVDYATPAGGAASLTLNWTPPQSASVAVPASALAPRHATVTKTVNDDNAGVPAKVTTTDVESHTGLVKAATADPAGLNLTTSSTYEDVADGKFRRPILHTLPAGQPSDPSLPPDPALGTAYAYYASVTHPGGQTVPADKGIVVAGCGDFSGVNQGAALKTTTAPRPDPLTPGIITTSVYDAAGRVVATQRDAEPWTCTTYDARGRVVTVSVPGLTDPAFGSSASTARTITHAYAVGANPLVTSVSDASGTLTTTVDLLGRVVATNDATGDPTAPANAAVDHPTRITYDQAGRQVTSDGPGGRLDTDYAGGRVTRQHVANPGDLVPGPVLAVPTYDAASGELAAVAYCSVTQTTGTCATGTVNGGNGTSLTVGRDPNGRSIHLGWSGPGGGIVDDVVSRSQSGAVVDETIDGTDANAGGANFTYDAAGRLLAASVPGHALTYAFSATNGCGTAAAGKDTNRTATTDNGGPATTYCYDGADRLVSSSDTTNVGGPVYDPHGNATRMGTQILGYDSSGRHVRTDTTTGATMAVTYTRDPANRLMARAENAVTTARYGFAGSGDAPAFAMDATNTVTSRFVGLAGGAMLTRTVGGADTWSYPNVHGDVVATANAAGAKVGPTLSYDPFGQALGALPDNAPGNVDFGWLGQSQRSTDHAGTSTLVEMGARPYLPAAGRFVTVDPVAGGSANDYDYVSGDPVNGRDLAGTRQTQPDPATYDYCVLGRGPYDYAALRSDTCNSYRQAAFNQQIGNPYDYSAPVLPIPQAPSGGGIVNGIGDFLKTNVGGGVSAAGRVAARTAGMPAVGNALSNFKNYYQACTVGAAAGAYVGVAASVATSGGLDSPLLVPTTTALGCVALVQYEVVIGRSA